MPRSTSADSARRLAAISGFEDLLVYLRDDLEWPIDANDFDDVTFDYDPAELGIDAASAAKILQIKQLRPLVGGQPWGIFFVKFEPKQLPVIALRRILSQLALKKRASANRSERAAWSVGDLLFVSNFGEGDTRQISFAHFSQAEGGSGLPTLRVLGWDNLDTRLHMERVASVLRERLTWPHDAGDHDTWRGEWSAAFTLRNREVITTSKVLATRLAELARAIRDRIKSALSVETKRGPVTGLMAAFKQALIHDLDEDSFADMYAQTIAYGLLSARIANPTAPTASGTHLNLPLTNPFLKELMESFLHSEMSGRPAAGAGIDFDELGVGDVVQLLDDADMEAIVVDFGDRNPREDPVIHFYELFLKQYDAKKRMQRGVFYTPRPIVSFMVRSVDETLRTEFGLRDGLADTATWGDMVARRAGLTVPEGVRAEDAFIRILDPATGTGTFLVEIIDVIYGTLVAKWRSEGADADSVSRLWNQYVPEHLLPRLCGYELLMAPYAIAHLKVGLKLFETGYEFGSDERAHIYLTNALEPAHDFSTRLAFAAPALAREAQAVNEVKRLSRFTVVIGNPPYSILSANLEPSQRMLVDRYRFVDGDKIRERGALQFEKNIQDDYVKFFALGEGLLSPSPCAVLSYISNGNYLDASTLRGFRASLCSSFESRLLVDLHGDGTGRGLPAAGGGDDNVFEILQGVAVGLYCRAPWLSERTTRSDIGGARSSKFDLLAQAAVATLPHQDLRPAGPLYEFAQRDEDVEAAWGAWLGLDDLFMQYSAGVITARDKLVIDIDRERLRDRIADFRDSTLPDAALLAEFCVAEKRGWNVAKARAHLRTVNDVNALIEPLSYRPLDTRWVFYDSSLVWGRAFPTMKHLMHADGNLAIAVSKQLHKRTDPWAHVFVTSSVGESGLVSNKSKEVTTFFPVLLTGADGASLFQEVRPNMRSAQLAATATSLGVGDRDPAESARGIFAYIYAIVHSPAYRRRYREQLARGFPRVPVAADAGLARRLVQLGEEMIALHLLRSPSADVSSIKLVGGGCTSVGRAGWSSDTVWIDGPGELVGERSATGVLGFQGVSKEVWELRIGSYQVCEKWLKDRKGRVLTDGEVDHYRKIVATLTETVRVMDEIDAAIDLLGGWPEAFRSA